MLETYFLLGCILLKSKNLWSYFLVLGDLFFEGGEGRQAKQPLLFEGGEQDLFDRSL